MTEPTVNNEEVPQEYIGLVNQAMTCYLNSFLQTLFMTPEFRNQILKWKYDPIRQPDTTKCIPYQLQLLFLRLQTSSKASVETRDITESFGWSSAHRFQQHDVQELTHVLFEALEQCWKGTAQENSIKRLYEGVMVDYVKCLKCNKENVQETPFLDVPLVIRPFGGAKDNESVEEAIAEFIRPEILEGSNKYACEKCLCKTDAHKGLKLKQLPYLLTLHLKRFDYNYVTLNRIKLNTRMSFPFTLKASEITGDKEDDTEYQLYSVMVHAGNALGGHYFSYIRSFVTNKWYEFNDQKVVEMTEEEVCKSFGGAPSAMITSGTSSTNAYMLVYRKNSNQNQEFMSIEEYPDHLKVALEDINSIDQLRERGGGDQGEYQTELFYKHCNSIEKMPFKFPARNTLQETTEDAIQALRVQFSNMADLRLVLYDIEECHCRESFNVDPCSPISVLIGGRRNMTYGLLLEHLHTPGYLELGDKFQKYIRGDFCCTVYDVLRQESGQSTMSCRPFVVRVGLKCSVGDLKDKIKSIRGITRGDDTEMFLYRMPRRSRLQLMPDDASGLHMDEDFKRHNILLLSESELSENDKPILLQEIHSEILNIIVPSSLKCSEVKVYNRINFMKIMPIPICEIFNEQEALTNSQNIGLRIRLEKGTLFSEFYQNLVSYLNIASHGIKIMDELCENKISGNTLKWTTKIMKIVVVSDANNSSNPIDVVLLSLDNAKELKDVHTFEDLPPKTTLTEFKLLILEVMRKSTRLDLPAIPSKASRLRLRKLRADGNVGQVITDCDSQNLDSEFLLGLRDDSNRHKPTICVEILQGEETITCPTDRLVYTSLWQSEFTYKEIVISDDNVNSLFEKFSEITGIHKNLLQVVKIKGFADAVDAADEWYDLQDLKDCKCSVWPLSLLQDGDVVIFRNMENRIDNTLFVKRIIEKKKILKDKTSRFAEHSLKIRKENK